MLSIDNRTQGTALSMCIGTDPTKTANLAENIKTLFSVCLLKFYKATKQRQKKERVRNLIDHNI